MWLCSMNELVLSCYKSEFSPALHAHSPFLTMRCHPPCNDAIEDAHQRWLLYLCLSVLQNHMPNRLLWCVTYPGHGILL